MSSSKPQCTHALFLFSLLLTLALTSVQAVAPVQHGARLPGVLLRWKGNCRCSSPDFKQSVQSAYAVVRVHVTWSGNIRRLSKTDRRLLIKGYKLKVSQSFSRRGPKKNEVFYAEAFDNVDFCGVRLSMGQSYLLNLADPSKRSAGSHWPKGIYVLDACQMHFGWSGLQAWQQSYLWSRISRR